MVTITNALQREGEKGSFVLLQLQGELEMVQSQSNGRFYATCRKCNISTTLELEAAKALIGKQLSGSIVRVSADPYEYTVENTGEVITLVHRWEYVPVETPVEKQEAPVVRLSVA